MKLKLLLLGSALLAGCAYPLNRVYIAGGAESNVAFVRKQIDHYKDGTTMERVMIWADGEWYELWNKPK